MPGLLENYWLRVVILLILLHYICHAKCICFLKGIWCTWGIIPWHVWTWWGCNNANSSVFPRNRDTFKLLPRVIFFPRRLISTPVRTISALQHTNLQISHRIGLFLGDFWLAIWLLLQSHRHGNFMVVKTNIFTLIPCSLQWQNRNISENEKNGTQ